MKSILRVYFKRGILLGSDITLVCLSLPIALFLRLDPDQAWERLPDLMPWHYAVSLLAFLISFAIWKPYLTILRLANLFTALRVAVSVVTGSALYYILSVHLIELTLVPRSLYIIQVLLLVPGCLGIRFSLRIMDRYARYKHASGVPTLIYGAGLNTDRLLPMFMSVKDEYRIVGIVDDDPSKKGADIQGVKVVGLGKDIPKLVERFGITHIILSMPSMPGDRLRQIVKRLRALDLSVKTLPNPDNYFNDQHNTDMAIRDLNIDDLLRRPPRTLDRSTIEALVKNQVVFIGGAGGSIGSELARQVALLSPKALLINDASEFGLYTIHDELTLRHPDLEIIPVLANLADERSVSQVFSRHKIDLVFHASAYKHVPLLENNELSAVRNNIESAENVFTCARKTGVTKVVLISSDKAVKPTNVMGATKRVCELLALWHAHQDASHQTAFACVRFGNVLGSNGSVLPKFIEQIKNGGPVTVTHPEMTRYFMLIPEAVSLVLQAASTSHGGEIYVLNMGRPVRIRDMANDLIELMGHEPNKQIKIVYTGLRPGEKMHEELHLAHEKLLPVNEDYSLIQMTHGLNPTFRAEVLSLISEARDGNTAKLREKLFELVKAHEFLSSDGLPRFVSEMVQNEGVMSNKDVVAVAQELAPEHI